MDLLFPIFICQLILFTLQLACNFIIDINHVIHVYSVEQCNSLSFKKLFDKNAQFEKFVWSIIFNISSKIELNIRTIIEFTVSKNYYYITLIINVSY